MKKHLLTFGMICSAFLSTQAQISPAMLWNFNFMSDAMPHTTQTWQASGFTIYTVNVAYNSNGKPTSFTTSTPGPMGSQVDQYKCTSSVSGNSLIDITQEQQAGQTAWENWNRTTFMNDGTNDTTVLEESYNTTTSMWENDQKVVMAYSGSDVSELTGYYWQANTWKMSQKNVFIYTAGKIDSAIGYAQNTSTGVLEQDGYRKYFYSTQLDSVLEYNLDNGSMVFSSRIVVNSSVAGKTSSFTIYGWENNAWNEQIKITYGTGSSTGLSQLNNKEQAFVYPNPATSELNINLTTEAPETSVTIIDMQGKTVLSQTIQSLHSKIDITSLHSGIYFVRLNAAGEISTQKFIKN